MKKPYRPEDLGHVIRRRRGEKEFSNSDHLAEKAGVNKKTIIGIEKGTTKNPRFEILASIAAALSTTVKELEEDAVRVKELRKTNIQRSDSDLKIFNVPRLQNPMFFGRDKEMDWISKGFEEISLIALCGMSGTGKTLLASEYAHFKREKYVGVWWINSENSPIFGLSVLAKTLKLPNLPSTITGKALAAKEWLQQNTEPWLVIYDNAESPDNLIEWVPQSACHCLITSQKKGWETLAKPYNINVWDKDIGSAFLRFRSGRSNLNEARNISHLLGGLPLALERAATFLKASGMKDQEYASDIKEKIKQRPPNGFSNHYPESVYNSFVKSFNYVIDEEYGHSALALLMICSHLSPDGIEFHLISDLIEYLPEELVGDLDNSHTFANACAVLTNASLAELDSSGEVLLIHRIVQVSIQSWIGEDKSNKVAHAIAKFLNEKFPSENLPLEPENWEICNNLLPHVMFLKELSPITSEFGIVMTQAGIYLHSQGDMEEAIKYFELAHKIKSSTLGPNHILTGEALNNLAARCVEAGDLEKAEQYCREVLEIDSICRSPDDAVNAITYSTLAEIMRRTKKYEDAEHYSIYAAAIAASSAGKESTDYDMRISGLSVVYHDWANATDNPELRQKEGACHTIAFNIARKIYGEKHPRSAIRYHNLARYFKKTNPFLALNLSQRAVSIRILLNQENHWQTKQNIDLLLDLYSEQKMYKELNGLKSGDYSHLKKTVDEIKKSHKKWKETSLPDSLDLPALNANHWDEISKAIDRNIATINKEIEKHLNL